MLSPYAAERSAVVAEFGNGIVFNSGAFAVNVAKFLVKELKYQLPVRSEAAPVAVQSAPAGDVAQDEPVVSDLSDEAAVPFVSSEETDLVELETIAVRGIRYLMNIGKVIDGQRDVEPADVVSVPTTSIRNRRPRDLLDGDDQVLDFWRAIKENAGATLRTSYGIPRMQWVP